ncbi:hypothetical protein PVSEL_0901450 [Plasmodium vinckei]|nr:hypothetical protein PVSEL_0901450 [Plasmodium vinckei]
MLNLLFCIIYHNISLILNVEAIRLSFYNFSITGHAPLIYAHIEKQKICSINKNYIKLKH